MATLTPDETRALLAIVRRVPVSIAESLWLEALFDRLLAEIEAAQSQNGDANLSPLADQRSDQAS